MAPVAGPEAARTGASGPLLVGGIVLASLTDAIAGTALALGRNDILGDTSATPDEIAWLGTAYTGMKLIAFALTPWLVTRATPQGVLLYATLAMGVSCAAAALTTKLEILIMLLAIQGLAGGALLVCGQALLFWLYPVDRQPTLQAIFAMGAVVAPATLAPVLQGWLLDGHSWTWIFFSVLPVALAAGGVMKLASPTPVIALARRSFDLPGAALFGSALFGATYVLGQGSRWDWFEATHIVWLGIAVAAGLVLFLVRQFRAAPRALLDISVFKTEDFAFAFAVSFIAGVALFGSAFLIPAFAGSVLRFTPTAVGQLLLPSSVFFGGTLLLAAYLFQVRGLAPITTVPFGILAIMAAMWLLSRSSGESGAQDMMPAILLRGLGLGFLFLSITLIAFARLPAASIAFGIGLFNIGRQLGGLIGVAGLQTFIDREIVANETVLSSALTSGSAAAAQRLSSTATILSSRGVEAEPARQIAGGLLDRAITGQATVIAFDAAFASITLFFLAAVPIVIAVKIVLARTVGRHAAANEGGAS